MNERLDQLLVSRGLAPSRTAAQRLVREGKVHVEGVANPKPGNPVRDDAKIQIDEPERYVSRGALKLEGAIEGFGITLDGLECLDVGASTGGFTDCMLQHGAARVAALDVGHGQLHPKIGADPRVYAREGFNCRNLAPGVLPFVPQFAACDVSFISLKLILPPMASVVAPGSLIVTLVKPQFEAGRKEVGKGGIVRDERVRMRVVSEIRQFGTETLELEWLGVRPSPITGAGGNVEYTALWRKPFDKPSLRRMARALQRSHVAAVCSDRSVIDAIEKLPEWNRAKTVLTYIPAPRGAEPPTAPLIEDAWRRGIRIAVPAWVPDGVFDSCVFPSPGSYAPALLERDSPLRPGPLSIPEPACKKWVKTEEIDLWIVPGLLFDKRGTRLGHGQGFIDRMLGGRRADSTVVGLALDWQVFDGIIPAAAHDVPMTAVVSVKTTPADKT